MQLLQKLRDSSNIESYRKLIERIERDSEKIVDNILEFLRTSSEQVIITYHRQGYMPSSIMYWFISTMEPSIRIVFHDANTITHYIIAYRESGKLFFISTNPHSAITINLLQAASIMGNKILFVTSKPLDPRLIDMFSKYNPLYISYNDELEASIMLSIATYKAVSKHYRRGLGRRGERLYRHSVEGFSVIVGELINKYIDSLEKIISHKELVVSSTKLLEPASLFFVEALRRINIKAHYEFPEQVIGPGNILFLTTSIEEYYARELLFKMRMMGLNIIDMVMNTDPLEAQIYYAILAYYLVYSWAKK
jgi:hypothetical protein